jgi:hypothetical protein
LHRNRTRSSKRTIPLDHVGKRRLPLDVEISNVQSDGAEEVARVALRLISTIKAVCRPELPELVESSRDCVRDGRLSGARHSAQEEYARRGVAVRAVNPLADLINDVFAGACQASFFGVKTSALSIGHATEITISSYMPSESALEMCRRKILTEAFESVQNAGDGDSGIENGVILKRNLSSLNLSTYCLILLSTSDMKLFLTARFYGDAKHGETLPR